MVRLWSGYCKQHSWIHRSGTSQVDRRFFSESFGRKPWAVMS